MPRNSSAPAPATTPAWQAVLTHGGFGYAKEYHVERLFREVMIARIAPVTEQLILCFIAEKVLDLPRRAIENLHERWPDGSRGAVGRAVSP